MGPVAPRHVGSSQTRTWTCVPCIGRRHQGSPRCSSIESKNREHWEKVVVIKGSGSKFYLSLRHFPAVDLTPFLIPPLCPIQTPHYGLEGPKWPSTPPPRLSPPYLFLSPSALSGSHPAPQAHKAHSCLWDSGLVAPRLPGSPASFLYSQSCYNMAYIFLKITELCRIMPSKPQGLQGHGPGAQHSKMSVTH